MTAEVAFVGLDTTRQRILEVAQEHIREYGIRRTTMEAIAERAGLSRAGLYKYFANKQVLVAAVLRSNGTLLRADLERRIASAASLTEKCSIAARYGLIPPKEALTLNLQDTDRESLAELLTTGARPFLERAIRFWEPHVRAAQETGEVGPALPTRQAAEWIARSLYGLVASPMITVDATDPAQIETFVRTFIVAGLTGREAL